MFSAKYCFLMLHRPLLHIRSVLLTMERSILNLQDIIVFILTAPFVWYGYIIPRKKHFVQCKKTITYYRNTLYVISLSCIDPLLPHLL